MAQQIPKVLVTEPIPEKNLAYLREHSIVKVGNKGEFQDELKLIDAIPDYDALLCMLSTPVTKKVLVAAQKLKIVANFAVGYNNIDVESAKDLGIKVANTPDVLTEACGDFAMGLLMAVSRKFNAAEQYLREGNFSGWEPLGFLGMELRGKTLGIIGMGRIGQAFAQRARAFGMNIAYHNRSKVSPETEKSLGAAYVSTIEELVINSDVLSLNCPLTDQTHHLVDKTLFKLMPSHSILINISRGPVVDEVALADALHRKTIAGAGIDVFENEPAVHPDLLTAPNCILLPHIASATFETREAIGMLASNAIVSVLKGESDSNIPNLI
ncbi:MAG: D-glycerate dehydrogenase [Balneola sp.]|nr:D-glycerate dehydrogenase [Balneola sp.]MBO6652160.1 D-glycerate dehydrogenase [Balneola sp.]MBO6712747.1 D-glycerate dehydrogenase [Balneola sp.]MBO6801558.1 D-glycerate dehydrogenase [Balneola sp.]MBO6871920.1 D-glycerate dehydrogenase [Balneola sp.]